MNLKPPAGSNISIGEDGSDPVIVIRATRDAKARFLRIFLLCWLVGWVIGEVAAVSQILSGKPTGLTIYFWLGGWTLGGALAAYAAFRVWRPLVPETLCLRSDRIVYDSGIQPPQFESNSVRSVRYLPRRIRQDLEPPHLQTLRLSKAKGDKRLTIDVGGRCVEIAPSVSGVERQWLARLLASRYGLAQVTGEKITKGG